jgi:hypothetical protein
MSRHSAQNNKNSTGVRISPAGRVHTATNAGRIYTLGKDETGFGREIKSDAPEFGIKADRTKASMLGITNRKSLLPRTAISKSERHCVLKC